MWAALRNPLIVLASSLILGTVVAPALATPARGSLAKWQPHKRFLARCDGLVRDVHTLATKRGLASSALAEMSPIQLTGSSVHGLPAFERRGQLPAFDDFDMR